jgi:hypothetical protein
MGTAQLRISSLNGDSSRRPCFSRLRQGRDLAVDRYTQAFVEKDYTTLRECVQALFVFTSGEMLAVESVDAIVTAYRSLREALEKRGYDHAEILETRITLLTADRALINAAYRRYKRDGSLLEEGAAIYPVTKSACEWKLTRVLLQDPKYFGKIIKHRGHKVPRSSPGERKY